ncbi:MAG TPA: hypothetical protein VJ890_11880 [Vineibacter sp.]|nr:hypothetical protein [Vineibacter sp.]
MAGAALPSTAELTRLYSRAGVRAALAWGDDKLRRVLAATPAVRPAGSGRGQQFTGADIWALYRAEVDRCGSRSTRRARAKATRTGSPAARTSTAGDSNGLSARQRTKRLLDEALRHAYAPSTVIPLIPRHKS